MAGRVPRPGHFLCGVGRVRLHTSARRSPGYVLFIETANTNRRERDMMTKLTGALIGAGVFFAIGTALAHAQALCDACF